MSERLGLRLRSGGLQQGLHNGLMGGGLFSGASLDLNFAANKNIGPLVSFTRASSGTYVGSDGVLKTATTNLKSYSDAILLGNAFGVVNATLAAAAIITPTGASSASLLTLNVGANTGNNSDGFNYGSGVNLANSTQHTQSLFAKPAGSTVLRIRSNVSGLVADFTLTGSGTTPSLGAELQAASITPLSSGWYRVSWTYTTTASVPGNRSDYWAIKTNVADGVNGIYVAGAQLEQSSTVGEYIPTTSTINSAPRFDHAITSSVTNLCLYSQAISTSPWAPNGTETCVASTLTDPAGGTSAFKINTPGTGAFERWQQPITVVSGVTYTLSAWVRSTTGTTQFRLRFGAGVSSSDFTATTTWQRFSYTLTAATTAGFFAFNAPSTGAATEIHVWGAQLEQSATVGTYVPTTTAAATSNTTESLGLLVEEQRTNWIRNNTMVGAVTGTPGTMPTNWVAAQNGITGVSFSVIGLGTFNGIPYIDIRAFGTPSATVTQAIQIAFEGNSSVSASASQTWTNSAWVQIVGGSAANITEFTLNTQQYNAGVFVRENTVAFTPNTSSFSRYSGTVTFSASTTTAARPLLAFGTTASAAIDITLRIGLPQLEQGAFATSVIPTTTATATRNADVASITGSNFGVSRTNLLLQSEEFDNGWTLGSASVTANAFTAPNGTSTADQLIEVATTANHEAGQLFTPVANTAYTLSCYFRAAGSTTCGLRFSTGLNGTGIICSIDLTAKTATVTSGVGTASITEIGAGWFRVSLTATASATPSSTFVYAFRALGTAGSTGNSIYLWGAQLETGSTATAYIPTTTAAVTVFESSWYRQDEGTVFLEGIVAPALSRFPPEWSLSDGTDTNKIEAYNYGSGYGVTVRQSGQTNADPNLLVSPVSGTPYKKAVALKPNDYRTAAQGQQGASTNPAFMPTVNQLQIGASRGNATLISSTIRRLTFWPARLPNSTLQQLTQ